MDARRRRRKRRGEEGRNAPPHHHHVGPATVDRGYSANLTVVTNMLAGCDKKSALQKKLTMKPSCLVFPDSFNFR
jgi:hypothetical protein